MYFSLAVGRSIRLASFSLLAAATIVGCSRQAELAYTPREELAEFPEKHQEQIESYLDKLYGTPLNPRLALPLEEQPEDAKELAIAEQQDRLYLRQGMEVYTRQCAPCHGTTGDGNGPAAKYLNPPPRDYRLGKFKFTSTARGDKPRREDLARIIRRGAKGTSMPSFRWMSEEDLQAVIDYVMLLSRRGELEYRLMRVSESELGEEDDVDVDILIEQAIGIASSWDAAAGRIVQPLTPPTPNNDSTVAAGAQAFVELNCYKCHGKDGRGQKEFNVGKDDWGRTAFAADLTSGMLHGGRRPQDIYRRIYSGINGTPMPAFNQPDEAKGETAEQRSEKIWNLVHFVTSIVEGRPIPTEIIDEAIKAQAAQNSPQPEAAAETPTPEPTDATPTETPTGDEKPAPPAAAEPPAADASATEAPKTEQPNTALDSDNQ